MFPMWFKNNRLLPNLPETIFGVIPNNNYISSILDEISLGIYVDAISISK